MERLMEFTFVLSGNFMFLKVKVTSGLRLCRETLTL